MISHVFQRFCLDLTLFRPKWYDQELSVDIPTAAALRYRELCRPISHPTPTSPMLPLYNLNPNELDGSSGTASTGAHNIQAPDQVYGDAPSQLQSTASGRVTRSSTAQTRQSVREAYWCVDKSWSEPPETWVCPIRDISQILDDRLFCKRLMNEYKAVRGIKGRLLSWKTCLDVHFIGVRLHPYLYYVFLVLHIIVDCSGLKLCSCSSTACSTTKTKSSKPR